MIAYIIAVPLQPDDAEGGDLTQGRVDGLLALAPTGFRVTVLSTTGSTNADLVRQYLTGQATEGAVVAAAEQTTGRGRLDRSWASPSTGSLSFSVLLQPPMERAGFVSPLTAVAVAKAVKQLCGLDVTLKWPNDVMVGTRPPRAPSTGQRAGTDEGKIAGILVEGVRAAVVVGCGINVAIPADELPVPTATSIQLQGCAVDRSELLVACLREIAAGYDRWREAGYSAEASGLLAAYRASCGTIGRDVRVSLPDGTDLVGVATGIDDLGRLLVSVGGQERALTAGDVVHLRPAV